MVISVMLRNYQQIHVQSTVIDDVSLLFNSYLPAQHLQMHSLIGIYALKHSCVFCYTPKQQQATHPQKLPVYVYMKSDSTRTKGVN